MQTCEFPCRAVAEGAVGRVGEGAERKSRGNMEVENITNKYNVWTESWERGGGRRWREKGPDEMRRRLRVEQCRRHSLFVLLLLLLCCSLSWETRQLTVVRGPKVGSNSAQRKYVHTNGTPMQTRTPFPTLLPFPSLIHTCVPVLVTAGARMWK